MPTFDMIAFDADDTLWHNERLYVNAQARLYETETRNLRDFGDGIKAFALSMITSRHAVNVIAPKELTDLLLELA